MNEFIEENKKRLVIFGIIVAVSIVLGIINMISQKGNSSANKAREERLLDLGKKYYEQIIYPIYKNDLEDYKETGFKIALVDIRGKLDEKKGYIYEVFSDNKTTCDLGKTYITIYPTKPYDEKSIDYKINLSCNVKIGQVETDE